MDLSRVCSETQVNNNNYLQRKSDRLLELKYPGCVRREENYVDVIVRTEDELILFEIKTDLAPRNVIRHALGQIMEYAFHPMNEHELPPSLVIVGRKNLTPDDEKYLDQLRNTFCLPLEYQVVSID